MPEKDIVSTIKSIEAGDEVSVETKWNRWQAMDVHDIVLTTWRVPLGEDWRTGFVLLEGNMSTPYVIDLDTARETRTRLYRAVESPENGVPETDRSYGPVTEISPTDLDDQIPCPDCGETFDDGRGRSAHINTPATDCSWDDGDEQQDGQDLDLPENVTAAELHSAVDEADDLEDVAGELDVTVGRARVLVRTIDRQHDVADPVATTAYRGGVRSR